jgi:hypothetical protein
MNAAVPNPYRTDWRSLYRAAILETDRNVVAQKVAEAEKAVTGREREIFYGDGNREERNALDAARYGLRALRTTLQHSKAA